jgi:hypothetical protein
MIEFILAALGTYYVTTVLVDYDGPFNSLLWLRNRLKALSCHVCASFYVALAFGVLLIATIGGDLFMYTLYVFGLAGVNTIVWELM